MIRSGGGGSIAAIALFLSQRKLRRKPCPRFTTRPQKPSPRRPCKPLSRTVLKSQYACCLYSDGSD